VAAPILVYSAIKHPIDVSYVYEPGIEPGVVTIVAAVENVNIPLIKASNYLSIMYDHETGGAMTVFQLVDVKAGKITQSLDGDSITITLPVYDRRWRWKYGEIAGWYNRRKADDSETILTGTEKTPQELAILLFTAMGEATNTVSVTNLPNDARPEVKWDRYTNPAEELLRLCSSLGCRIVPNWSLNKFAIYQDGQGFPLPINDNIMQPSVGLSTAIAPSSIYVDSAPIWYDRRFELAPVALDVDGKYKEFDDPDLSYRISSGEFMDIDGTNLRDFASCGSFSDEELEKRMKLASRSVYRTYVVRDNAYNKDGLTNIWQVELLNQISEKDGDDRYKSSQVLGKYLNDNLVETPAVMDADNYFSLDTSRRLVKFSSPMYLILERKIIGADLVLRCCSKYRLNTTFEYDRDTLIYDLNVTPWPNTKGHLPLTVDHIQAIVNYVYSGTDFKEKTDETDNFTVIEESLNHYAIAESKKYIDNDSASYQYRGLFLLELDGLRSYLEYSFGIHRPITTLASLNCRPNVYVPDYRDKVRGQVPILENKYQLQILKNQAPPSWQTGGAQ